MSIFFSDEAIASLIQEDVPYLDLTTYGLAIGKQLGEIEFSTRHPMTICATEEAARVLQYCGAEVHYQVESGTGCQEKQLILQASGTANALHSGWRVALNLMEYASGIASRTRALVDTVKTVNPAISIVTTRKCFPGTRAISIKAVLAGGGFFHRLGLSETVLIFNQHLIFLGGMVGLIERMNELRKKFPEQRICVEVETVADALMVAQSGVDLIQFDKISLSEIKPLVLKLKQQYPNLKLAAAGGITSENIKDYASSGVDILVTSSPYFGKPCDIAAKMTKTQ
ncbi:molybdenum transport system protein ModD [Tolypothrix tenuis PCC 7101]|uniref:Putative pyrophosphorylase ModD n=1 Tax=Tolypothrix tenuis PCC 7101 TaxID=231146 RepID=A0A1Z4N2F9_9CYAN|nr:ModD protein [Aulosira sp. FACHB-113]BAY99922.1 molybdenum transport system protein ModD [Tolypothrix tenuis PCC 7101]BAZ76156.1 molybdenum transport system protein ModD [Aulosira laxa NIES-50]